MDEKKFNQEIQKNRRRRIQHWKVIAVGLMIYDAIAIAFSYVFGLWIRFDFMFSTIEPAFFQAYLKFIPWYVAASLVFFWFMRMYRGIWRFAGFNELLRYASSSLLASMAHSVLITLTCCRMPFSYHIVGGVVQLILVVGIRFSYRFYTQILAQRPVAVETTPAKRVMIIGAGAAGRTVVRELQQSDKTNTVPVCMIDDNSNKWSRYVEGVPVVGGRENIAVYTERLNIDEIYFCIPTATVEEKKEILNICNETGCKLMSLPGIYQIANDEVLVSKMKNVAVEDLLGREPIRVDMQEIFQYIQGKTILVTGGGGSIGSELCRQIAAHEPKQLIIFDIYENNAYEIEQELRRKYPQLNLAVLIGSVRDSRRINGVFETYRPDIVYHAAAHKHVPLMEHSPNEAIKNNVIGTYKTAYAALTHGTQRFVLISTDKAVNPTNIMGASKRLCEMVIQSMDAISKSGRWDLLPFVHAHKDKVIGGQVASDPLDHRAAGWDEKECGKLKVESVKNKERTGTQFVAVRFGNVLGSNGSVIPLFKKQIENGGPVTVTHPDITRFFMTIPEAVSLVLQAGTYAWGGEIFVLDMGEPVKIDTLARNLIKLSGYKPDEDIKIEYTGLRPGEKLYEEKLMAEEGIKKTDNKLIYIGKPIPFEVEEFLRQLEELADASYENSPDIVEMVAKIVPTFHPAGKKPDEGEIKREQKQEQNQGQKQERDQKQESGINPKTASRTNPETASNGMPVLDENEEWVKKHREEFGNDPGFF
ncbi:MAG: polysaccharide biosynthesis protein [Lachnospiraceae bacterium]|nr:polysaccharide biosynthesis protein [Lachnospiraceae bacterium]